MRELTIEKDFDILFEMKLAEIWGDDYSHPEPEEEITMDEIIEQTRGTWFFAQEEEVKEPTTPLFGGHFNQIKKVEFENKTYYSDNITPQQLINDMYDRHIILSGGVGTGKTTLIKDLVSTLHNQGNNVFYMCNRKKLRQQVEFDVNVIPLSYQYASFKRNQYQLLFNDEYNQDILDFLGEDWINNLDYSESNTTLLEDLSQKIENSNEEYYFIFDEIHYLIADATFNKQTNDIFEFMSKHQKKCHFILISASADYVWEFLSKGIETGDRSHNSMSDSKFINYYIPDNFDHVKKHYHYGRISQLINIIKNTDGKVIVGSNNMKTWRTLLKEFGDDVTFVQSEFEPEDEVARENWLTRQEVFVKPTSHNYHSSNKGDYFDSKILCTTSALDNGVSIIDPENAIKCVFCEFTHPMSIYQFIGRVRRQQGNGELANVNMFYKIPKQDDFFKHVNNLMGRGKVNQMPDVNAMNDMQKQALKYDVRLKMKLSLMINDKRNELLEYNFKQMYLDVFYHGEVFKQPVTIHNATQYMKDLGIEMKEQIKEEIINKYLNVKLKSSDIKSLTKELKWYQSNGKKNLTINETIDKLTSLNYNVDIKVIRKVKEFIITK